MVKTSPPTDLGALSGAQRRAPSMNFGITVVSYGSNDGKRMIFGLGNSNDYSHVLKNVMVK